MCGDRLNHDNWYAYKVFNNYRSIHDMADLRSDHCLSSHLNQTSISESISLQFHNPNNLSFYHFNILNWISFSRRLSVVICVLIRFHTTCCTLQPSLRLANTSSNDWYSPQTRSSWTLSAQAASRSPLCSHTPRLSSSALHAQLSSANQLVVRLSWLRAAHSDERSSKQLSPLDTDKPRKFLRPYHCHCIVTYLYSRCHRITFSHYDPTRLSFVAKIWGQ